MKSINLKNIKTFKIFYWPLLFIGIFTIYFSCKKGSEPPSKPTIADLKTKEGLIGSKIIIDGTNLSGITQVLFNKIPAVFTVKSATEIEVTVPSGIQIGDATIVAIANKDTANLQSFFVTIPGSKPVITSMLPAQNIPGQQVMLYGSNLIDVNKIMLGTTSVQIDDKTDIAIIIRVPKIAVGSLKTIAIANTGSSNSADFEIVSSMPAGGLAPPPSIIVSSPPPPGYIPGITNSWNKDDIQSKELFPRIDICNDKKYFTLDGGNCSNKSYIKGSFSINSYYPLCCVYYKSKTDSVSFAVTGEGTYDVTSSNGVSNNFIEFTMHFPDQFGGDEKFVGRFYDFKGWCDIAPNARIILISTKTGRQLRF